MSPVRDGEPGSWFGGASTGTGLELADHLAVGHGAQIAPGVDVDVVADEAHRAVTQQGLHAARMLAACRKLSGAASAGLVAAVPQLKYGQKRGDHWRLIAKLLSASDPFSPGTKAAECLGGPAPAMGCRCSDTLRASLPSLEISDCNAVMRGDS